MRQITLRHPVAQRRRHEKHLVSVTTDEPRTHAHKALDRIGRITRQPHAEAATVIGMCSASHVVGDITPELDVGWRLRAPAGEPYRLQRSPLPGLTPITEGAPAMSLARVHNFAISLDGYFTDAKGDMTWAHKDDAEWQAFAAENASGGGALVERRPPP